MSGRPGTDFPGLGTGLAILRDGKLLLYRRLKAPEANHWNIVGGKVEFGETTLAACRREAIEECGLAIGAIAFLCASEQIIDEDRQHWVSMIYVTSDTSGDAQIKEPEKLPDCGWFDLDALPSPLSRFARDAVAAIRKADISG